MSADEHLELIRHSLAHIMAAAVQKLWPEAQFGVGPTVDNGFYYDIYLDNYAFSDKDLKKIEKTMRNLINRKQDFVKSEMSIDQAIDWAKQSGQSFKVELLTDLKKYGTTVAKEIANEIEISDKNDTVTFYQVGDFVDLCRGPHIANTSEVGAFKLMRVSGAYWRGDETKTQMSLPLCDVIPPPALGSSADFEQPVSTRLTVVRMAAIRRNFIISFPLVEVHLIQNLTSPPEWGLAITLLVADEPGGWLHTKRLAGIEHRCVFVDEILPRHEDLRLEALPHLVPRGHFVVGVTMTISMQDKRQLRVVEVELFPIADHLQLELVHDEYFLGELLGFREIRQPG